MEPPEAIRIYATDVRKSEEDGYPVTGYQLPTATGNWQPATESPRHLPISDPMRLRGLGAEALPLVFLVLAVVAVEPVDAALAFEREDVRRDAVEEPAVVRDDDGAAGEGLQRFFQRAHGVDIEIVRRLVEQEDVRALLQYFREVDAISLAARQHADFLLLILAREIEAGDVGARVHLARAELHEIA